MLGLSLGSPFKSLKIKISSWLIKSIKNKIAHWFGRKYFTTTKSFKLQDLPVMNLSLTNMAMDLHVTILSITSNFPEEIINGSL